MEEQVIDCVSEIIDWAQERVMDEELDWVDARSIAMEFKEWLDEDEIDLLYLDKLD